MKLFLVLIFTPLLSFASLESKFQEYDRQQRDVLSPFQWYATPEAKPYGQRIVLDKKEYFIFWDGKEFSITPLDPILKEKSGWNKDLFWPSVIILIGVWVLVGLYIYLKLVIRG